MCGITGFIDFSHRSSRNILQAMTATLSHRGPDGEGVEFFECESFQVGLGHRRLAILDLSQLGHQPMRFRSLWLTFNGEVYNFKEIRKELSALGHTFLSNSDSEVVLHAYHQWGRECLAKFIGMFSFAIYDEADSRLFVARDRVGVKPLFYYMRDNIFLFGSELKALHGHPEFQKDLNISAIAAYMQYGYVPAPHCIFLGCRKVRPGHFVEIDLHQPPSDIEAVNQVQYWNVYDSYNSSKYELTYQEALEQTTEILTSAFEYRMVSDVPVGVFLSGGYDSVCVASVLQANRSERIKTFTIAVPDIGLNEAPHAKAVARYLGTDHTEMSCTEKEAMELVSDLPYFFDEPFGDSSAIPTTLVCKVARSQVPVALSADAGDEIFAGYNHHEKMIRWRKRLNLVPGIVRNAIFELMNRIPNDNLFVERFGQRTSHRYQRVKAVLGDPSNRTIALSLIQQMTDFSLRQLIALDFSELETLHKSAELQADDSPLSYILAMDYQTYLVDDILQKVDRASMSQSLEGREPFLDHRIVEFCARLPDEFKFNGGVGKKILRDIVHQKVPKELMDRPKMGFTIPMGKWLMADLRDLVETYVERNLIEQQGLFCWEHVACLKSRFHSGDRRCALGIWKMIVFQMWAERWSR